MTKLETMKLKKKLLSMMLAATLGATSLTGCGSDKQTKKQTSEASTSTTIESTTEITTEEIIVNEYSTLAVQSYNEYKEFYDSIGVEVNQIENMIKVINDDLSGLTRDDLTDSIDMIDHILLSEQLGQKLDNINMGIKDEFSIPTAPKLSVYVEDSNIKSDLENYETIRDQVINSANTGVITENDKELLKNAIITMEENYNKDQGYMNSTVDCEGNKYLQNAWKKHLVVLAAKTTGETEVKGNNGDIYPICTTPEETNIIAQYNMLAYNGEDIPDSLQLEYTDIKLRQIITKYDQGMCSLEEELYRKIEENLESKNIKVKKYNI